MHKVLTKALLGLLAGPYPIAFTKAVSQLTLC